jgi:hypothetical protein
MIEFNNYEFDEKAGISNKLARRRNFRVPRTNKEKIDITFSVARAIFGSVLRNRVPAFLGNISTKDGNSQRETEDNREFGKQKRVHPITIDL